MKLTSIIAFKFLERKISLAIDLVGASQVSLVVKIPIANVGDVRDAGSVAG